MKIEVQWGNGSKEAFKQVNARPKIAEVYERLLKASDGTGQIKREVAMELLEKAGVPNVTKMWDTYIGGSESEKWHMQHCQSFIKYAATSKGVQFQ